MRSHPRFAVVGVSVAGLLLTALPARADLPEALRQDTPTPLLPIPSPSALLPAPAPADTTVRVSLPRSRAPLGKKVVLSGTVSGGRRSVVLQTRDANGRWRTLSRRTSSNDGAFRFRTPTWNRTHPLRVRALSSSTHTTGTSRVVKLRRVVSRTTGGSSSSWSRLDGGPVVRWNPCETIRVRVNKQSAPSWFGTEVRSALRNLQLYTGLDFELTGTTRQRRLGADGRWSSADLVLLWDDAGSQPRLAGQVVGVGGSRVRGSERADGVVILDRKSGLSRTQWRIVIRHELAHVLGLGHVNDRKQRMTPSASLDGNAAALSRLWGRGDVAGLKRVGASYGCTS